MILDEILRNKEKEIKEKLNITSIASLKERVSWRLEEFPPVNFEASITEPKGKIKIIAEIKKASPSSGIIRKELNVQDVAKIYQVNGASAISVVVDRRFFQGSIGFLRQVKQVCKLPILCKDFVISDYQIYEAASEGADAILLIASYMTTEKIQRYLDLLRNLKLFAVVEIHSEEDLEKVLKTDTKIIGINNRDLRTFKVDLNTTLRLKRMIPSDLLVISESGIKTRQDLVLLEQEGINAVLVGETLLKSSNIKAKLLELLGKLNNDEG